MRSPRTRLHPRYRWIMAAIVLVPTFVATPWAIVRISTASSVRPADATFTHADAAVVLGAAVYKDGRPSRFLRERIEVGVKLYLDGTVDRIIMSGDGNDSSGFGEPNIMRKVAEGMGVPADAIVDDPLGRRHLFILRQRSRHVRCHERHHGEPGVPCAARGVDLRQHRTRRSRRLPAAVADQVDRPRQRARGSRGRQGHDRRMARASAGQQFLTAPCPVHRPTFLPSRASSSLTPSRASSSLSSSRASQSSPPPQDLSN